MAYVGSYAAQQDYAANPITYSADYYLNDLIAKYQQFSMGAAYEVLDGDGVKGFSTPLATLHRFQGWADKFLVTPPNGIEDYYFTAGYAQKGVGPFAAVSALAVYHRFYSERLSLHYGNEINGQLQAQWKNFAFTFKYANYQARTFATDTQNTYFKSTIFIETDQ